MRGPRRRRPAALLATVALALGAMSVGSPAALANPAPASAAQRPAPAALSAGQLQLQFVVGGLSSPVGITHAGDGSGRLFIVQRGGRIRVVKNGAVQPGNFLDISSKVLSGGEQGLLGLAFHPDFETNRQFFVYYTRAGSGNLPGDIVIARYLANLGLATADPASEVILLVQDHGLHDNHNGGMLAFGPDGYLYAALGDGGGGGDPEANGQKLQTLLGKILRLDVDGTGRGTNGAYAIPPDNPFAGPTVGFDEIWAYGMRNPWRFSFDRETGELYIGDVGQNAWEEIDREAVDGPGGRNYGWNEMEGMHCYPPGAGCTPADFTLPIAEYGHSLGCSVTGGYVYRGPTQLDLVGAYVLADYCTGRIWTIPHDGTTLTYRRTVAINISSFGESEGGELYAVDLTGGRLYRVVAPEFGDILNSSFLDDIHWIFYQGITTGCGGGNYCPLDPVSRGQMASFLARALDLPATPTDFFPDDNGTTHEANINRIAAAGITSGCGGGLYCPNRNVTRAEMATFLVKALDLPPTTTDYFSDDNGTTHEPNINALAASGITTGCGGGKYCPTGAVTREQMAGFLHRAFD